MLPSKDLESPLRGLSQARLLAAALVLATGAMLGYVGVFPYAFPLFALVVSGAVLSSLMLLISGYRIDNLAQFAWLQLAIDMVLVTALVATSGGSRSVFTFLYVLVVMEGCFLLSRSAGLVVAGLSSLLYLGVVWGDTILPHLHFGEPTETTALEVLTVFLNVGVLLVIAMLAGSLAERYHEARQHLETKDRHLSDLQAFRDLIFESVGSGLIAVNPAGRITAYNQAAEAITGIPAAEALDRPWESIFGPGIDFEEARQAVTSPAGKSRRYEIRVRRRDGRDVPVGISFWLLRSGQGEAVGLIGVCQDLSSIKQMEERVRQADRLAAVGRLAANIAHEIRNPLASLSGAIETLARDLPPDPGRSRLLEIVLGESERLNHIIRDFLEYARPAPLTPLDVNLAETLEQVLTLLEHRASPGTLKIVREFADTLPARADPQQIRQALWNLCINAVESMPDGGELRVGGKQLASADAGPLQLWISDTGQGIGEQDLPHIFEPFYSTKSAGSGIGLALVYRVVQEHGGHIEVRSRAGAGTTFTLMLPGPGGRA